VKRQQIVTAVVGVLVGFILGFFVAQGIHDLEGTSKDQQSAALPENHPSPEVLEELRGLLERVQADPNDREGRVLLGNSFYDIGRFDAAIQWYEEALALDPSDIRVSTDLGTAYLYTGKVDTAIGQYKKSLELRSDHPQTLQNMGIAYFSRGEYQRALEVWQELMEFHPDYPNAEEIKKQISSAEMHLAQQSSSQ
jgi:cytochrome c-type biogenesis protein CcmH/NrfG